MKTKPSRPAITANLTLLALALLFGLSLFFAAHFYAIPVLTAVGAWAIAHIGLVAASWIAGAVAGASLLAISAESLQGHSTTHFLKGLIGSVLNLVTLFTARKGIQKWLGLGPYQTAPYIPTKLKIQEDTDAIRHEVAAVKSYAATTTSTIKQLTEKVDSLSSRLPGYSPEVSTSYSSLVHPPVVSNTESFSSLFSGGVPTTNKSLSFIETVNTTNADKTAEEAVKIPGAGIDTKQTTPQTTYVR